VKAFGDWVMQSSWLAQVGADYGVGLGQHVHVVLQEPAPTRMLTPDDQKRILDGIASGELPSDPAQPNDDLYMFVFSPETTTDIAPELGCGASNGKSTGAWHDAIDDARGRIAYAVIPTCAAESFDAITVSMTHELIEAATDPFPMTDPAYQTPITDPFYSLAEVGDRCELGSSALVEGHSVARVYSSSHETGHGWACLPTPSAPYFRIGPEKNGEIAVKPGDEAIVPLAVAGDVGPEVQVLALSFFGDFEVSPSLDRATANVGDELELAVPIPSTAKKGQVARIIVYGARAGEATGWPLAFRVTP
jgi:hypothetical protein